MHSRYLQYCVLPLPTYLLIPFLCPTLLFLPNAAFIPCLCTFAVLRYLEDEAKTALHLPHFVCIHAAARVLQAAQALYEHRLISYPRTETNRFTDAYIQQQL